MNHKNVLKVLKVISNIALTILLLIVLLALEARGTLTVLISVLIALLFAISLSAFILVIKYYRCPHCGRTIRISGPLGFDPFEYCPRCGKKL